MAGVIGERPLWQQLKSDGRAARRAGAPNTPPDLSRYRGVSGALTPEGWWRLGWEEEDECLAVEASRPTLVGEDLWRQVKRG